LIFVKPPTFRTRESAPSVPMEAMVLVVGRHLPGFGVVYQVDTSSK
jgi:hypothetical protein